MKIVVCSPSYNRPKVESFDYLPFLKVYVGKNEVGKYQQENKNFEKNINAIPNEFNKNVAMARNYILNEEFKNGADVVCMIDDDLKGIFKYNVDDETKYGYIKEIIKKQNFMEFLKKYSQICNDLGFKLWGVNCNSDKLSYRHYTPFSFSSVILGPFCCHLKNDLRYDERLPLKEDYDLAIQHLNKYRGILRLNGYFYDCKQSENKGGCATYRNMIKEKEQFDLLQKKWGSRIVKYDKGKRAGTNKKKQFDYNPIINIPIKGV